MNFVTDVKYMIPLDVRWECPRCGFVIERHETYGYLVDYMMALTRVILDVLNHMTEHIGVLKHDGQGY